MAPSDRRPMDDAGQVALGATVRDRWRFADFTLDVPGRVLTDGVGRQVPLRRSEFALLLAFVREPGRVLSRDHLLDAVAGRRAEAFDRSIDVLVGRLRRKVEHDSRTPCLIVTVPGLGYKFAAQPAAISADSEPRAVNAPNAPCTPRAAERRQLTVMHCALARERSARLDPEDLHRAAAAFHASARHVITRSGGTVAKLLGDGVLAYFGYPQAGEHDAERAITAALSLIQAVPMLESGLAAPLAAPTGIQIGIASGLVVIGDLAGTPEHWEHAVFGESLTVAARMASCAAPCSVVIAANTRRLVGNLFEYRELRPATQDGFGPAVQVIGRAAVESRFEGLRGSGLTPFVGREEELELLLRRWEQAGTGSGRVVLVTGEPGVGKSRLVHELQGRLSEPAHVRRRYFCSPHHTASPFYPIVTELERMLGRDATSADKRAKLESLRASLGLPDEAIALIAALLSIKTEDLFSLPEMSPQKRKEKTLAALLARLTGLAARQPALILFEDVHWIDPSSGELLDLLVARVRDIPALLVITFRPEFTPPWTSDPQVTTLVMNRLDQRRTLQMVRRVGGEGLAEAWCRQIAESSDGVPLFIEELTKTIFEEQGASRAGVPSLLLPVMPATLRDLLTARLDRLGDSGKEIAQIGAVIGREFSYGMVQYMAQLLPEHRLREGLRRLVRSELIRQRGAEPDAIYIFKHALVQEAAYRTLLRADRQRLHALIAQAFEARFPELVRARPEHLAEHCSRAGLAEKAVDYWLLAAQNAIAKSAMHEALAQLGRGLTLAESLPDGPDRWRKELDLQYEQCRALAAIKSIAAPAVGSGYGRARQLCERLRWPRQTIDVLYGEFSYHMHRGELRPARQIAQELTQLGHGRNEPELLASGYSAAGYVCFHVGALSDARAHLDRVLALLDAGASASRYLFGHVAILSAWSLFYLGFVDQARQHWDAALAEAQQMNSLSAIAYTLTVGVWRLEPVPVMIRRAEKLLAIATEQGFPQRRSVGMELLGWCLAESDRPQEAIALLEGAVAGYRGLGFMIDLPAGLRGLAFAYRKAGQPQKSLAVLVESAELMEETGMLWGRSEQLLFRGEALADLGEYAAAEASLRQSLAVARSQTAKLWELRAGTSLARLWHKNFGKYSEARDLLEPLCDRFVEGSAAPDLIAAKALLDNLCRNRQP